MRKCDFNKVAKQLFLNHTSVSMFFCKFAAYFQNAFLCRDGSEQNNVSIEYGTLKNLGLSL